MIELDIDSSDLVRAAREIGASERQVRAALRTTVNKMAAWAKTRSVRELSSELRMTQRIIRRRLRATRTRQSAQGVQASVWYGTLPVSLIHLGARKAKGGVRAQGGRFVQSAFIARGRGGREQVFKRKGRERLPIERQREAIAAPTQQHVEQLAEARAFEQRFQQVFDHELTWQMKRR